MSKFYKDLGKDSKDLLSQDFFSGNSLSIIALAKTPNNAIVKGSLKRNFKTDPKTKVTREVVEVLVEPKWDWKSQNVEFNSKLTTSRDFSAGFVSKDLVKGVKFDFQSTLNEKDGLVVKLSPSYKSDNFSTQFGCAYPFSWSKKTSLPIKWNAEVVFQLPKKLYLGLNFLLDKDFTHSKKKIEGALVSHASHNSATAAKASYDLHEESVVWSISHILELSRTTKWSAEYELDSLKGPTAQIGAEYKINDKTTLKSRAVVKAEVGAQPDYRLALSLKQRYSKHLKASFGADINVRQFFGEGVGHAHSLGCEIEISED